MSAPLAEALVAAQRRALAALEKAYVADKLDAETVRDKLVMIGLPDEVDADRLLSALDLIREHGAPLPTEPANGAEPKPPEKATANQVAYVQKLLTEKQQTPLAEQDLRNLSKDKASELIDSLLKGTYDPSVWDVAF